MDEYKHLDLRVLAIAAGFKICCRDCQPAMRERGVEPASPLESPPAGGERWEPPRRAGPTNAVVHSIYNSPTIKKSGKGPRP